MLTATFIKVSVGTGVEVGLTVGECADVGTPSWLTMH